MKIALFSDIHANLPAFEAFLADLDSRQPDTIYCLGDMIGYNVWPNEVIEEIRRRGIATLMGNHDQKTNGYAYELVTADNRVKAVKSCVLPRGIVKSLIFKSFKFKFLLIVDVVLL